MTPRDPAITRLLVRLDEAGEEIARAKEAFENPNSNDLAWADWARTVAIAQTICNVYNWIEDVIASIAANIDGDVPKGENWHRELLDQMTAPLADVRPSVIDAKLRMELDELRRFRHVVRHGYGARLDKRRVEEHFLGLLAAHAGLIEALRRLDEAIFE
jgi:hypothetical protein